jgi:hypothetical protein
MDPDDMEVTHVDYDQALVEKIPSEMREAIFTIIEATVKKRVEEQVAKKMEVINEEMKGLKGMIE